MDIELISDSIPDAAKAPQHLQTLYFTWSKKYVLALSDEFGKLSTASVLKAMLESETQTRKSKSGGSSSTTDVSDSSRSRIYAVTMVTMSRSRDLIGNGIAHTTMRGELWLQIKSSLAFFNTD